MPDANKRLHAYRDWRGRLDDVDVVTLIESEIDPEGAEVLQEISRRESSVQALPRRDMPCDRIAPMERSQEVS
jgi:hypothetical protein